MAHTPPSARTARGRSDGIGRPSSKAAERVSDALRRGSGAMVRRRRRAAGLMLAACGSMGVVALYQFGLVRHLPEPPASWLHSDRVDAAGEAYAFGLTPDTALALSNYGVTLALIGMGAEDRAERHPWMPILQAAKVALDAAGGAYLTLEQASKHRAFCFWCLMATAATAAAVPYSLPEARAALRRMRAA